MFINYLPRVNKKNNTSKSSPIISMGIMNYQNRNSINPSTLSLREVTSDNNVEKPREMLWGKNIWFLFHTLAEKVDEKRFLEIRVGLLNTIYIIVCNLPCPICSEHGKTFLDGINFNTIVTKENLKYMIFDFHNLVNHKKHFPTFLYTDLVKYETAITINIIQNFMGHFSKNSGSIRLIADDLYRKKITTELKKWFNENIGYFAS
jgi:hypothetical protein